MTKRILTYVAFAVVAFVSFHAGERYAIGNYGVGFVALAQEICTYQQDQIFIPSAIKE